MTFLKLMATAIIVLLILDMIWLGGVAQQLYDQQIGGLLRKSNGQLSPNWIAAMIVYVAIAVGIIFFAAPRAEGNLLMAFAWGCLFGAVCYSIYDFTNLAVLANWPLKISIIDVAWGTLLCGITNVVTVYVQNWLNA